MYLEEKIKLSSFTFGFELEAILNNTEEPTKDGPLEPEFDKGLYKVREKFLEPALGLQKAFGGSYMYDGSIHPYSGRHTPFEFVSGVLNFNDATIRAFTSAMQTIKSKGVYTNQTCGFHIHFGFPDTTRKQLLWIKTVYLFDTLAQSNFEYFQSTQGPIPFWSARYASVGNKSKIAHDLMRLIHLYNTQPKSKALNQQVDKFFTQDYFTSKYNVLGIHEKYRTLEWRGPRGFLNTGNAKDIIQFVKTLRMFVKWLSSAEDTPRIVVDAKRGVYITREDFYNLIDHHAEQRVNTFGVDVAERIDAAKTNKERAEIAFQYFKTMNFQTKAATNYRKIANRIKYRFPKAWEMFIARARKETTFPQLAMGFLQKIGARLGIHEELVEHTF